MQRLSCLSRWQGSLPAQRNKAGRAGGRAGRRGGLRGQPRVPSEAVRLAAVLGPLPLGSCWLSGPGPLCAIFGRCPQTSLGVCCVLLKANPGGQQGWGRMGGGTRLEEPRGPKRSVSTSLPPVQSPTGCLGTTVSAVGPQPNVPIRGAWGGGAKEPSCQGHGAGGWRAVWWGQPCVLSRRGQGSGRVPGQPSWAGGAGEGDSAPSPSRLQVHLGHRGRQDAPLPLQGL